jgi:hypothetical protein
MDDIKIKIFPSEIHQTEDATFVNDVVAQHTISYAFSSEYIGTNMKHFDRIMKRCGCSRKDRGDVGVWWSMRVWYRFKGRNM